MNGSLRLRAARLAAIAAVYYGAAKLGLSLAFATTSVTAVWPPTGIALAAVLLWGYRVWPGIALGAFLANSWTGVPLYTVLGITIGNTCEALGGAYLLRRFTDFRPSLERVKDVIALAVLGGCVSTIVSATAGVASLLAAGEISGGDLGSVWRTWWLGDMGGDLLVAPAILVAVTHWPFKRAPGRPLEAVVLGAAVGAVAGVTFSTSTGLIYLIFPLLVWAVFRFWQPGAVGASLLVAGFAVPFTADDIGPFSGNTPDERLLLAQTFVGIACLTALVLAAVTTERARATESLRKSLAERERAEQRIRAQTAEIAELAEERGELVQQVVAVEDRTRKQIAESLHDDALQTLLAVHQELIEVESGHHAVARARDGIKTVLDRLRVAVQALRPVILTHGDLAITLNAIAHEQARRGGFRQTVRVEPDAAGQRDDLVLSVARELLANVATHAHASRCSVSVDLAGDVIDLKVLDDGQGFPPERRGEALREGHVGLALAAQRVRALGGELEIRSDPANGTAVRASIPVSERHPVSGPR
jgi:integral membrane sensor domain MASE1/anti-sigma regulatory factor (Ser/Thr protein kinase)